MLTESTDVHVVAAHTENALLRDSSWHRFAMLGDSIAAGVGDPLDGYRSAPWADRLADALARQRPELQYLNVAERDREVEDIVRDQLPGVLAFRPDLVGVNGGANDMFRREFDVERVRARYEPMVAELTSTGATVMTWTMLGLSATRSCPSRGAAA